MKAVVSAALGVLFLLGACGNGAATVGGVDSGAAGGGSAQPVGAAGATVTSPGGVSVQIPSGALGGTVTVRVVPSATPPVPPPTTPGAGAQPVTALTAPIALLPHGTTFAHPVLVTVPVDRARLSAEVLGALDAARAAPPAEPGTVTDTVGLASRLGVMRLRDDSATAWEPVDTGVSVTADGQLSFLTDRFSYYYVFSAPDRNTCRACTAADQTAYNACLRGLNWFQCLMHVTCTGTLSYRGTPVGRVDPLCGCGAGVYRRVGNAYSIGRAAYCSGRGTCTAAGSSLACACDPGYSGPTCAAAAAEAVTCDALADAVDRALMCPGFVRSAFVGSSECGQIDRPSTSPCYAASQAFMRCLINDVRGNFGCDRMAMSMSGVGFRADRGANTCQGQLDALQSCR